MEPFHNNALNMDGESTTGVLPRTFCVEVRTRMRQDLVCAMPPAYEGCYPPWAKSVSGTPARLVTRPHSRNKSG